MNGLTAYALSKGYVNSSLDGLGALKGSPCTIKSTTETDQGTIIVFEWTGASGATEETTILVKNGKAGVTPTITAERNADDNGVVITITNPDGTVADTVVINDGTSGVATSIDWSKVENKPFVTLDPDSFKVDENGVLTIVESGEGNKINSISVNGTEVTPDENKNVDITVPTISTETGNMIETKADGIYVKDMSAKVSDEEDNQIETKDDGLYVPPIDLSEYSKTEEIEEFVDKQLYNTTTIKAHYEITDSTTANALEVVADGTATDGQIDIGNVTPLPDGVAVNIGDYVVYVDTTTNKTEKYVLKVNGKDLSTNDLTDELLEKLNNADVTAKFTKADYKALSEEEQNNGMVYIVIDEDTEIVDLSVFAKSEDVKQDLETINDSIAEINNAVSSLLVPTAVLTGTVERSEDGTGCASIPITSLTSGKVYIIKNKATVIPCQGVWLLNFIGKGYTELIRISQVGGDTYSMVKYSDNGTTIDVYSSDSSDNEYVFYELPY